MKIFFSYPHDANAELVRRFRDDLMKLGHDVWFDESQIKGGDDWRERITRGIVESERAVAFLSKHSTREPGVCLNEIAIVQGEKGDALITVLVEPENEVNAPVCITHIQWLPMQDWAQRLARGGAEWDAWYRDAFARLLAALENPFEAGRNEELEALRTALAPMSFNAEIARHIPQFTGRQWLLERYDQWLEQDRRSKVFRIEGGPGMGKSAISARLAYAAKNSVIGIHLCKYNLGDTRDPRRMVQSLAFQMASRLPDYRARLMRAPLLQEMAGKDAGTLWNGLIVEPLSGLMERQRLTLVIDALDEASENGANAIVDLLAAEIDKLPGWIGLVITGRPDDEVKRKLRRYAPLTISGDDRRNLHDIQAWLERWLSAKETGLDAAQQKAAAAALMDKCEGTFLYLQELRQQWESERNAAPGATRLDLTRPDSLPVGLTGIYHVFFERRFVDPQATDGAWRARVRPLLELVLACPEPLPLAWADALLGWDEDARDDALRIVGSLFPEQNGIDGTAAVAPFHKSVREWLQDRALAGVWRVNTARTMAPLAAHAWRLYLGSGAERDAVAQAVLPVVLPSLTQDQQDQLIGSPSWEASRALFELADLQAALLKFSRGEQVWRVQVAQAERLLAIDRENLEHARDLSVSFNKLGDTLSSLGRTDAALGHYQRGLGITETLVARAPENAQYARNLSISFDRLGNTLSSLGRTDEALGYYQRGLGIRETLDARAPENAQYARDLSISFDNLGDTLSSLGRTGEALGYYQRGLGIRETLAARAPGNAECARDLSISFMKLGNTLSSLGLTDETLEYHQRGLEIAEELVARTPENAQYARDLWVSFNNLGDTLSSLGRTAQALGYYQRGLEIAETLAARAPESAEYARDLSISFERLGDTLSSLGRTDEALGHYRRALTIAETLTDRAPENAQHARYLWVNFNKLGDMLSSLGRTDEALGYYQRGLGIAETLAARAPENAEYARDLSINFDHLGNALFSLDRTEEALGYHHRGLAIRETLAARAPENARYARDLSVSFDHLGNTLLRLGRTEEALGYYERGLAIRETLAARAPENAQYARDLSISFNKLGDTLSSLGRTEEALEYFQSGLAIRETLAGRAPESAEYARDLSISFERLGDTLSSLGRADETLGYYRRALVISEALIARAPENAEYARDLSIGLNKLGDTLSSLGRKDEALGYYQRGMGNAETPAARAPENAGYARDLAVSLYNLWTHTDGSTQSQHAERLYQHLLAMQRRQGQLEAEFASLLPQLCSFLGTNDPE